MSISKELIKEKYKYMDSLKKEIKELENQYAVNSSKFKIGDIVTSSTIKDSLFEVTEGHLYDGDSDQLWVACKIITTSNEWFKPGMIQLIPEIYLTIKNNG